MQNKQSLDILNEIYFARNSIALCTWEILWAIGSPLCMLWTIVPTYMLILKAPRFLIQIVMLFFTVAVILQLYTSKLIYGKNRKVLLLIDWLIFCSFWLSYSIFAIISWNRIPHYVHMIIFLLACMGLAITMNLGSPPYIEMCVTNIPLRKRGRFMAMKSISMGTAGLIGIFFANNVMKKWEPPVNFHYSMLIGSSIMFLSCFSLLIWKDNAGKISHERPQISPFIIIITLFKNINFRIFLFFFLFSVIAMSLAPLFISYAKDILHFPVSKVTYFTAAFFIGPIFGGSFFIPMADKYGFRLIAFISALLLLVAFLIPLFFWNKVSPIIIAYILYSCANSMIVTLPANLGSEIVKQIPPAVILAATNTIIMPVVAIVSPLSGLLIDVFGYNAYVAVFSIGVISALVAFLGFRFLLREPRTGQELHILTNNTIYR